MVAGADKPVTKQSAPLLSFLSESMKISRMVEVLEGLPFDSREQGRIVVDRVTRNYFVLASRTLACGGRLSISMRDTNCLAPHPQ